MTATMPPVRFRIWGEWVYYDAAWLLEGRLVPVGLPRACDGCGHDDGFAAVSPAKIRCVNCNTTYRADE